MAPVIKIMAHKNAPYLSSPFYYGTFLREMGGAWGEFCNLL